MTPQIIPLTELPIGHGVPEASSSQPAEEVPVRRSSRVRQLRQLPDNVYGSAPAPAVEQLTDTAWQNLMEDQTPRSPRGQAHFSKGMENSGYVSSKPVLYRPNDHKLESKPVTEEGGVSSLNFFLHPAEKTPPTSKKSTSGAKLPNPLQVRNWNYKDIQQFLGKALEEWKHACREEISSLHKRNVFSLVKLPKGKKAISNRWVFDIKSDGRKKARLVAKGFSQIEGIDYNELFSPVV